jgi:hypothetical protein
MEWDPMMQREEQSSWFFFSGDDGRKSYFSALARVYLCQYRQGWNAVFWDGRLLMRDRLDLFCGTMRGKGRRIGGWAE